MQVLILDSTSKTIEAVLSSSVSANQPEVTAQYADSGDSFFEEASSYASLSGTTPVTIVAAPASGYRRVVKDISVYNADTASVVLTIKFVDGATKKTVWSGTVTSGSTWTLSSFLGTISSTGTSGHIIVSDLGDMPDRTNLKFAGEAVSVSDDIGSDSTIVTISGGSGGTTLSGGVAGEIAVWNSSSDLTNYNTFLYDTTNDRVIIGLESNDEGPATKLALGRNNIFGAGMSIRNWYTTPYPYLSFFSSQGTQSSMSPILSGDVLGTLTFFGNYSTGGGAFATGATIRAEALDDWASHYLVTKLILRTTVSGDGSASDRLVLDEHINVYGDILPDASGTRDIGNSSIPFDDIYFVDSDTNTRSIKTLLTDAPSDSQVYGRQDGSWVTVSGGYGVSSRMIDQSGGSYDTYTTLSGTIDGSNNLFYVSYGSYVSGTLQVYLNGQLQTQGDDADWTEQNTSIGSFTFNTAPVVGDDITAVYHAVEGASGNADTLDGLNSTAFVKKADTDVSSNGWVLDEDDLSSDSDTKVPTQQSVKSYVDNHNIDGWISPSETWTYASATSFTITGDLTGRYSVGDKIKLTQTTVKYFYITAISYSSPSTIVTITGGSDYTLANAAITDNYYSKATSPNGFPDWFNVAITWDTTYIDDGSGGQPTTSLSRFKFESKTCRLKVFCFGTKAGTNKYIAFLLPFTIKSGSPSGLSLGSLTVFTSAGLIGAVLYDGGKAFGTCQSDITDNSTISYVSYDISYEVD